MKANDEKLKRVAELNEDELEGVTGGIQGPPDGPMPSRPSIPPDPSLPLNTPAPPSAPGATPAPDSMMPRFY